MAPLGCKALNSNALQNRNARYWSEIKDQGAA